MIGGTIAVRFLDPDEKLEAGADYDLFVFVKAADGSTLKDLTAANAKLDGKAAEAVDLLSDGVTAVIIFKLTPLEASHTHTYGTEWKSDAYKHWHECSCGAKAEEAAHTASNWILDTPATAATAVMYKKCTVCDYVMSTITFPAIGSGGSGSSGGSSGGSTTPAKKPVQSVDTGDMGIALYAGMALLSLTGGAWVVNKKRKGK